MTYFGVNRDEKTVIFCILVLFSDAFGGDRVFSPLRLSYDLKTNYYSWSISQVLRRWVNIQNNEIYLKMSARWRFDY